MLPHWWFSRAFCIGGSYDDGGQPNPRQYSYILSLLPSSKNLRGTIFMNQIVQFLGMYIFVYMRKCVYACMGIILQGVCAYCVDRSVSRRGVGLQLYPCIRCVYGLLDQISGQTGKARVFTLCTAVEIQLCLCCTRRKQQTWGMKAWGPGIESLTSTRNSGTRWHLPVTPALEALQSASSSMVNSVQMETISERSVCRISRWSSYAKAMLDTLFPS